MSHVATIEVIIKDQELEALGAAVKELGLELVRDQKTFKSYQSGLMCDHAIRVPGNPDAYEIGVVKRDDGKGYELKWDTYGGGRYLLEKVGTGAQKIKQGYATQVAIKAARAGGFRVVGRSVKADGTVLVSIQR